MIEAWWDRNSAIGAWQYSIPPDASPATVDWDRFLGSAPKVPFEPIRLFRWRNYRDYGTGVAGDLFVHLFSGMHFIMDAVGPTRVFSTGGLRFWKDGRDVPDIMLGLCDYPETANHPAFNLALRVNFVNGSGETYGFRFVGSEGVLSIGDGVTVSKQPRESEPGYTIDTFPKVRAGAVPEGISRKISGAASVRRRHSPPGRRTIQPATAATTIIANITEFSSNPCGRASPSSKIRPSDSGPPDRRFFPCTSYFEQRAIGWDPQTMTIERIIACKHQRTTISRSR